MYKALVGLLLSLGIASVSGCSFVETYYTYDDVALKQMSDELVAREPAVFKDRRPMNVLGTLGHFLEATKIRVKIERASKTTLRVHKTYTLTDDLKKVVGDKKVNLESEMIDYPDCSFFDERNWSCEDFFRSKYEMKDGQLYVGGIKLKKNYMLKM